MENMPKPKSAFELAMERLAAADREAGVSETPLTEEQKKEIAECRAVATSRLAEREILFKDALARTGDPEKRETLEREYRIDRDRIDADRDRQIENIRKRTGQG